MPAIKNFKSNADITLAAIRGALGQSDLGGCRGTFIPVSTMRARAEINSHFAVPQSGTDGGRATSYTRGRYVGRERRR